MKVSVLHATAPTWNNRIEQIRSRLGAPGNPLLMPAHFLKVVLPKIGGAVVEITDAGKPLGYGFLFPRRLEHQAKFYTCRYHALAPGIPFDPIPLQNLVAAAVDGQCIFYDPAAELHYQASHRQIGNLDFGHPGAGEAADVRDLQRRIWNNPPDLLYPVDIHSVEFGLATSLIARAGGETVAFLFGFYKFGGSPLPGGWAARLNNRLRIESQTMGVLPAQRGQRTGYTLKRLQAEQARRDHVDIINWTADPLQYANAVLNFSRLRAIAYEFQPDLYDFRNELNRVPASRFNLTWLVGSERVQAVLSGEEQTGVVDLRAFSEIVRVNDGRNRLHFEARAPLIAIEIPADWYHLQQADQAEAQAWRKATDRLLAHYVGPETGQYIITAAGVDGARRYLIGERVDDALLKRLVR